MNKKLNKLAIPLMLNTVSSLIINLCDQAIIGRTDLEGFAVVSIIGNNIYSITGVLGAISVAITIIGSKAKGENDVYKLNSSLFFSLFLSLAIGITFSILCILFGEYILRNVFNIKSSIINNSSVYLYIFSFTLLINLLLFNISSYFKIINNTKYILYANVLSSVLNVVFDYILVFGKCGFPKLGIVGNAMGTVLSLSICLYIYILIIVKHKLIKIYNVNIFKYAKDLISVSTPIVLEEFFESVVFSVSINYLLSQIGLLEVSIYNLIFNIVNIALMPMYAYSQAGVSLISESIGSKNVENINIITKLSVTRASKFYIIIGFIVVLFKEPIISLITNDTELIINTPTYILTSIAIGFIGMPNYILKSNVQALGYERFVFRCTVVSSIVSVLLITICIYKLSYGLYGVYIGILANYIIINYLVGKKFIRLNKDINETKCIE